MVCVFQKWKVSGYSLWVIHVNVMMYALSELTVFAAATATATATMTVVTTNTITVKKKYAGKKAHLILRTTHQTIPKNQLFIIIKRKTSSF